MHEILLGLCSTPKPSCCNVEGLAEHGCVRIPHLKRHLQVTSYLAWCPHERLLSFHQCSVKQHLVHPATDLAGGALLTF